MQPTLTQKCAHGVISAESQGIAEGMTSAPRFAKRGALIREVAGWAMFAIITVASIGPIILLISPPAEVACWKERRLVYEKYQSRTMMVKVCEVRG